LNPNYVAIVKQDINKLFVAGFIKLIEEATWLLSIVVVLKKNEKLKICVTNFKKFNVTTKKDLYLLPFTDEVINIVTSMRFIPFWTDF